MGNIVTVEANNILAASVAGVSYSAPVTPIYLALITDATASTATVVGSEVANGDGSTYARQNTTSPAGGTVWGTPSGGTISNSTANGAISFTNMPACNIAGIELWDSHVRTVSDGVTTASSTTITSATASFTSADVGQKITGGSIPANTTIASVTNSTTAVLSAAPTSSASTVSLSIVTPVRRWFGSITGKTVNAGDTVTFAQSSISITLS